MLVSFFSGFWLSFTLIFAIGAQNAFVLRQGLKKQWVFLVCMLCALSDAILIVLGIVGFGAIIKEYPFIVLIAKYSGAVFLFLYGLRSLFLSFTKTHLLTPSDGTPSTLIKILFTCLAFTWLNPHVYIDTVFLIGSISTQFEENKLYFGVGAILASLVFFFTLGYGAQILIPIFQKPISWKIFEFTVAIIMFVIAINLIV